MTWTLEELAEIVGGTLHGPSSLQIARPVPAGDSSPDGITFAESDKYVRLVEETSVGAVIVGTEVTVQNKPYIRVASPREAFGRILAMSFRDVPLDEGIHPTALVHPQARVEPGARIGAYSIIERHTVVKEGACVYPFCYIGPSCEIGLAAKLYPHAVLYGNVVLGERVIVHAGAVLGADGFGYFWDGKRHRKVPQVGSVAIGNDCELGALTAVDRATAGSTRIGGGSKLDNLIQIAHNVEIGESVVVASQSGVAGSSTIGDRSILSGQVGVGDHVVIGEDVQIGAKAGVPTDVIEPGGYWGALTPRRAQEEKRIQVLLGRLPELVKRVKELEREVEALKSKE